MNRLRVISKHLQGAGSSDRPPTKVPDDIRAFMDSFRRLSSELAVELGEKYEQPAYIREWIRRLLYYSVPGGKLNRGMTVVHSLEILKGRKLTQPELQQAHVLGWCVEWLQAFFLLSDDVMDSSITRRGAPCWYRAPHPFSHPNLGDDRATIGLIAVNDSFIVEAQIYRMLKMYFREEPFYVDLLELFQESSYQTELGQLLDLTSLAPGKLNLDSYTEERYRLIVRYKTAFYSFYLPVVLALVLHHKQVIPSMLQEASDILLPMGEFFQVQDDYLDCYADPKVLGKVGRDIEEAKCGWLAVKALELCNEHQRSVMEEHYGKEDRASVTRIKALYRELHLESEYQKEEAKSYNELRSKIDAATLVPGAVYDRLLSKIYKRQK